jgi:integrase
VKAVLSVVLSWGAERGYLATNPADGINSLRRKKGAPEANRPWSDEERYAVLDALPLHMRAPVGLMMYAGLGPKDALTLPRNFYRAGEIATRRSKTGEPVFWPVPQSLAEDLAKAPAHNATTLCANSDGKPWTLSGFRSSWRPIRLRLEKEGRIGSGLTLYGLRHTVAVILREMGRDERDIGDALGQKTIEMARHYAKGADLRPKMRGMRIFRRRGRFRTSHRREALGPQERGYNGAICTSRR